MFRQLPLFTLSLLLGFSVAAIAQQNSVLAEGTWFKIGVTQTGVYKLSSTFLKSHGIVPDGSNLRHLQIRGYGGGMVPETIAAARPQDLPQLAIQVVGESDGILDAADHVLFYAQGPDALQYQQETGWFTHQKNIYSDTAYYFISLGSQDGVRQTVAANEGLNHPAITSYEAVEVYEKDEVNIISSGRRWFGEAFGYTTSLNFPLTLQDLTDGSLRLRTAFMNANKSSVTFSVALNGQQLQSIPIRAVDEGQYANKGWIQEMESQHASGTISNGQPLQLTVSISGGAGANHSYLDYFLLQAPARLRYRGQPFSFIAPQSLNQPVSTYKIAEAPQDLQVWDVSDPLQPLLQEGALQNSELAFGALSTELHHYIAFTPATAAEPEFIGVIANQNLRADLSPELLIITHPSLQAEAERLAAFRRNHDGLAAKVVSVQQVYNEFSSGRQDIAAIRDYVRHLYKEGGQKLKYLLLFGRGYYDYKQRTDYDYNLVPLYESYNSTHPIYSYASDDFYGFLEDHEGDWAESEAGNQSLEIGIGRLPVATPTEARQVVDKLIRYSSEAATMGNWRQRILFVADDEDGNVHQLDAETLANIVEADEDLFNIRKIYVDAYPKNITANSQTAPAAQAALHDAINQGALIVNFTGHGSYRFWTFENIFSNTMAERLQNTNRLPLFVTATCEFGLHDASVRSGAESLVLNPTGGAIGLLTTSRPVFSYTNLKINSAFYRNAFPSTTGESLRLGDIMRLTKNEGVPGTGINNRNFILLGDPSLQLAYPRQPAVITAVTNGEASTPADTLKAFEKIMIEGAVLTPEQLPDNQFNGTLLATIYDKSDVLHTLGQTDPSMPYRQRQNVLYRGETRVKDGQFSFEMAVPKNIRYDAGFGRVELYAIHQNGVQDAAGATEELVIGGSATPGADASPPEISLYLNDTTFTSGNPVDTQALLLAKLGDENGINISYSGLAQDIEAQLDDSVTFILNDYYTSINGSYKEGWLRFPLNNLAPGQHKLRLQVWDTHGNMSQQSIDFYVPGEQGISISKAFNYPNPFRDHTTFAVTHNRAGDDLEMEVVVYTTAGQVILQAKQQYSAALSTIHQPSTPLVNKNIIPGLYVFKVILRSLSDGSVAEKTEKLVIVY